MKYTYTDSYLAPRMTDSIEQRAIHDVTGMGLADQSVSKTLITPSWAERLTIVRAYIICCLEHMGQEDDTFTLKLKSYQEEWLFLLKEARASGAQTANGGSLWSVAIARN